MGLKWFKVSENFTIIKINYEIYNYADSFKSNLNFSYNYPKFGVIDIYQKIRITFKDINRSIFWIMYHYKAQMKKVNSNNTPDKIYL